MYLTQSRGHPYIKVDSVLLFSAKGCQRESHKYTSVVIALSIDVGSRTNQPCGKDFHLSTRSRAMSGASPTSSGTRRTSLLACGKEQKELDRSGWHARACASLLRSLILRAYAQKASHICKVRWFSNVSNLYTPASIRPFARGAACHNVQRCITPTPLSPFSVPTVCVCLSLNWSSDVLWTHFFIHMEEHILTAFFSIDTSRGSRNFHRQLLRGRHATTLPTSRA